MERLGGGGINQSDIHSSRANLMRQISISLGFGIHCSAHCNEVRGNRKHGDIKRAEGTDGGKNEEKKEISMILTSHISSFYDFMCAQGA